MLSSLMGPLPTHGFRMRASGETIRMSMPCSTFAEYRRQLDEAESEA